MAEKSLRRATGDLVDKWFQSLEESIYRRGYARTLTWIGSSIAVLISLFSFLGVWTLVIIVGCFALITSLCIGLAAVSGTGRLRQRESRLTSELQTYGKAVETLSDASALVFIGQSDEVVVAKNGDVTWSRTFELGKSPKDIPHYLRAGFTAAEVLRERVARRVRWRVSRQAPDGVGHGVEVLGTQSWQGSSTDSPMFVVHAYLGTQVQHGEKVTVEVEWPKASASLRKGRDTEEFFMRFTGRIHPMTYEIRLTDQKHQPNIEAIPGTAFSHTRDGNDWVVEFHTNNPQLGERYGVTIDLRD